MMSQRTGSTAYNNHGLYWAADGGTVNPFWLITDNQKLEAGTSDPGLDFGLPFTELSGVLYARAYDGSTIHTMASGG